MLSLLYFSNTLRSLRVISLKSISSLAPLLVSIITFIVVLFCSVYNNSSLNVFHFS